MEDTVGSLPSNQDGVVALALWRQQCQRRWIDRIAALVRCVVRRPHIKSKTQERRPYRYDALT